MNARVAPYLARLEKRKREVVTPEGLALPLVVASRSARAGALMLDFVILMVTTIAFNILLSMIGMGGAEESGGFAELVTVLQIIFWFVAWNGYFLFFEMGPRGATPGKRAAGIRVAARDGGRLTPEAVVARNLLRDIELFMPLMLLIAGMAYSAMGEPLGWSLWMATLWFLVFLLFPFFNRDAMRAGDLIAGTWVVEAPKAKLKHAMSVGESANEGRSTLTAAEYRFGEQELSVYGEYELQTLERVLRDGTEEALVAVHETICRKIGWNPGAGDERAFLEAFYNQLRARLESDMRFGKRKADKFS